jgi:hypothetical protein
LKPSELKVNFLLQLQKQKNISKFKIITMEKSNSIQQKEFSTGFFINLECCFCNHQETVAAESKKTLSKTLNEKGWKLIDSDEYKLIGHHCGCDYR